MSYMTHRKELIVKDLMHMLGLKKVVDHLAVC